MRNDEIRREAKHILKGNWKIAILNLVIAGVLATMISQALQSLTGNAMMNRVAMMQHHMTGPGSIMSVGNSFMSILLGLLSMAFSVLLYTGYDWSMLDLVDGQRLTVEGLFQAMKKNRMLKVVGLNIAITVLVGLWSLLLIIPGIIKAYSYSQALNILKDDPDVSIREAIRASKEVMHGKKAQFFWLDFSFAVWYLMILGIFALFVYQSLNRAGIQSFLTDNEVLLTLIMMLLAFLVVITVIAILSLYIEPYRKTAKQLFYRDLVGYPSDTESHMNREKAFYQDLSDHDSFND